MEVVPHPCQAGLRSLRCMFRSPFLQRYADEATRAVVRLAISGRREDSVCEIVMRLRRRRSIEVERHCLRFACMFL